MKYVLIVILINGNGFIAEYGDARACARAASRLEKIVKQAQCDPYFAPVYTKAPTVGM